MPSSLRRSWDFIGDMSQQCFNGLGRGKMEGVLWKRLSQHIKACFGNAADQMLRIIYPMFVLGDSYASEFLFYIIYTYL